MNVTKSVKMLNFIRPTYSRLSMATLLKFVFMSCNENLTYMRSHRQP